MKFSEFDFKPQLIEGLSAMGFEEATPIQEDAIPRILANKDLIACAQTGTGKTAAFLLPILEKIGRKSDRTGINTLVIAPTRELALQIDQQVEALGYFTSVYSAPVYGGGGKEDFGRQEMALRRGVDIVIATPGKLLSHLNLGYVDFSQLEHLVLDEADRMLDMGFFEDIMRIVHHLPKERQTLLFSATMPPKIRKLAQELLQAPEEITIAISKPAEGVLQGAYMLYPDQKIALLQNLLEGKREQYPSIIIFTSRKRSVQDIVKALRALRFEAAGISSDLEQQEREAVLNQFTARRIQILVGTDVIARGIDIKDVNLVVNFDVPQDAEDYVHRVGRTARADTTGVALTFITGQDQHKFARIEALIEMEIHKIPVPEAVGEAPTYNPKARSGGKRRYGGKGRGRGRGQKSKSYKKRGPNSSK